MVLNSSSSFEMLSEDSDSHLSDGSDLSFVEEHRSEPPASQRPSAPQPQAKRKLGPFRVLDILNIVLIIMIAFIGFALIYGRQLRAPVAIDTPPFNQVVLEEMKLKQIKTAKMEQKLAEQYAKVSKIKEVNGNYNFPEYLWDKWTPDPTRFVGVAHLLHRTGLNGTALEKFIYTNKFKITRAAENGDTYHPEVDVAFTPLTTHPHYRSYTNYYKIKNGDMIIDWTFFTKRETLKMTLVYYIPISDII